MTARRVNKASSIFELWHSKDPRDHIRLDLSGTKQDFPDFMVAVGTAVSIIYSSDKWEKDKNFFSYVHDFDSGPKVYFPEGDVDPPEELGRPKKTTSFLGISSFKDPLVVAQLAFANELVYRDKEGSEVVLDFGKGKSQCLSSNDLKTLIILTPDGPLFIRGGKMRITERGIVK